MKCYTHGDSEARGVCVYCGKALCEACAIPVGGRLYCKEDVAKLVTGELGAAGQLGKRESDFPSTPDDVASLLTKAALEAMGENGIVLGAKLADSLRKLDPGFSPRKYGAARLSEFVAKFPDIIRRTEGRPGSDISYRVVAPHREVVLSDAPMTGLDATSSALPDGIKAEARLQSSDLVAYLDILDWKKTQKFGSWHPLYTNGSYRPEILPLREMLQTLKSKGALLIGDNQYRMSEDGQFLFRTHIDQTPGSSASTAGLGGEVTLGPTREDHTEQNKELGDTEVAAYLEGLKWTENRFGSWRFAYYADGTLRPEMFPVRNFLEKTASGQKITVGDNEYWLAGDEAHTAAGNRKQFLFRQRIRTAQGQHAAPPSEMQVSSAMPELGLPPEDNGKPIDFAERMNLELAFWADETALVKRYDREVLKPLFRKRGVGYQYQGPNLRLTKYVKEAGVRDYYDMLGLTQRATPAGVEAGFAASKRDQNAKEAYAVLSDSEKRAEYDKKLTEVKELFFRQVKLPSFRMLALGGAREIGRSSYYVRIGEGHYVLLDAGVKVENTSRVQKPRFDVLKLLPPVEAIFISHPHADHITGLAEALRMAREVLDGVPIYMTEMTKKFFEEDKEALVRRGSATKEEMDDVFSAISTAPYGVPTNTDGLTFEFRNAGHVPGSAMVLLKADGDTVLYTGDLNFERTEFEVPAKPVKERIATLIMEATYAGESRREDRSASVRKFVDRVTAAIVAEKKVLIPAFTIGRCAEVVKILDDAIERGDIAPVKAYTLGLGAKFMQKISYKPKHFEMLGVPPEVNDTEVEEEAGEDRPARLPQRQPKMNEIIRHLLTLQASPGSHIIVAGSGFGDQGVSGRMISSAWDKEDCLVLFSGYVPAESVGGIMIKAKETGVIEPMAGSPTPPTMFKCEVDKIGLSAHASEEKLISFIEDENPDLLILIHTKPDEGDRLAKDLERRTMVPANLQICFDWGQRGFRLMPYNSEIAAVALRCSCSPPMAFTDLATAMRHTAMEGCHLVRDSAWYYFGFTGRCPAKFSDVKRSFLATAPASVKVAHVTLHGIVVEGTLTEEDIKLIQINGVKSANWSVTEEGANQTHTKGAKSTSWAVGLEYDRKEELPIVSIKFPIAIAQIKDAIVALLGKDFILPDWRVELLPPDTGGYYDSSKDKLVVNANTLDEEDTFSVIAHELTHCAQYKLNDSVRPKKELNQAERKAQDLFMEGFAQYVVVKLGHSKKLLTEIHEKVTPAMYYNGRKMFEAIEAAYGVQRTIEIGLTASPHTFVDVHASAWKVGAAANPELVAPVKEELKKVGVWKSGILGSGFSSEFRREMEEYEEAHWRAVLEEFEGWAPKVVLDDIAPLLVADLLISKYSVQTGRDNLRKALAFIIRSEQPEVLSSLRNVLLRSTQEADEKDYLAQSEGDSVAPIKTRSNKISSARRIGESS